MTPKGKRIQVAIGTFVINFLLYWWWVGLGSGIAAAVFSTLFYLYAAKKWDEHKANEEHRKNQPSIPELSRMYPDLDGEDLSKLYDSLHFPNRRRKFFDFD